MTAPPTLAVLPVAAPPVKLAAPPVPEAWDEIPAVKLTAPPTAAELEVPVVIVMEPALPADELVAPVVMIIPPLEPPAFPVPEVNSKAPLTPLEPLAAVLITTLPLDFEVPAPDESDTAPPVPVVLDPAANDMSPPILLEPELVAAPAVAKNEPPSAPAVAALPAVRDTEPPSPLEPVAAPLVIEIAPPLPPVLAAAPVLKSTAPLLPQLVSRCCRQSCNHLF